MARYNRTGPESPGNNENCQKTMENRTRLEAQGDTVLGVGAQFEDARDATCDNTIPHLEENGCTPASTSNMTQSSNLEKALLDRDYPSILGGIRYQLDWQLDNKAFQIKAQGCQAHSNNSTPCGSVDEKCSSSVDVWSMPDAGSNYILHAPRLPTIGQDMNQTHVDNVPRSVCLLSSTILALIPEGDMQLQRWLQRFERHEVLGLWLTEIDPIPKTMTGPFGEKKCL